MGNDILIVDIYVYNDSHKDYEFLELVASCDEVHVQLCTDEANELEKIIDINELTDGLLSSNVIVHNGEQHLIVRLPVNTKPRNGKIFLHWLEHAYEHEGWHIEDTGQTQYIEYYMHLPKLGNGR